MGKAWVPAVMEGFDSATNLYCLNVQPKAHPTQVRAALKVEEAGASSPSVPKAAFPLGADVEYFSASQKVWVPAVMEGFNSATGLYSLNVQPKAHPNQVRAALKGKALASNAGPQAGSSNAQSAFPLGA